MLCPPAKTTVNERKMTEMELTHAQEPYGAQAGEAEDDPWGNEQSTFDSELPF